MTRLFLGVMPLLLVISIASASEAPTSERVSPAPSSTRSGPTAADAVAAYRADPAAYVAISDPSRAWLAAEAGPDVPALSVVGSSGMTVARGGRVPLRLRAAPRAPVSFVTFGGGQFANGADAITVTSDADGIAEAIFHATPDAVAFVQISAACPLCVGQAGFTIEIGSAIEESP